MKTKVLFLYTELAGYFLSCVEALVQQYAVEVHIVRWPLNQEAPFQFDVPAGVQVYERQNYTREQLIRLCQEIAPRLVFCSGWVDKDYLAVVRSFKKEIPILVGMDNQWQGSVKQYIASLLAPFTLQRLFTHAFVAGAPQKAYARKLGFSESHVLEGYYAADVGHFQQAYLTAKELKAEAFPRRFLYVGRYVPEKGVEDLWQAFVQLQGQMPNDWELWCLGTGPLAAIAVKHPKVKHFGFVQPQALQPYINQTSVFVLPSHFEPWGVVIHEFAAAGFPLLCSHRVGAATAFLKEGINGFSFEPGNVTALKEAMKKLVMLPEARLRLMGEESRTMALQNTPSIWAEKLMKLTCEFA